MNSLLTLAAEAVNNNAYDGKASVGTAWAPVATWVFGIVIVGAILLFFSFLPGWINTVRTKDTASMSLGMWVISVVGLSFLVIFYALGMANSRCVGNGDGTVHLDTSIKVSAQFAVVFTCEAASLVLSVYVLVFKLINMKKAKSLGITEKEYCKQLAAKSTGSKSLASMFKFGKKDSIKE